MKQCPSFFCRNDGAPLCGEPYCRRQYDDSVDCPIKPNKGERGYRRRSMSAYTCRQYRRGYDTEAPETWVQRYSALRDLCPDCVGVWITENVPENREPHTEGGFLDGIKGAGEE